MATMLRALVMLGVLVGGPAAWIYYGPLPPEAQRTVDRLVGAAKQAIGWDQRSATHYALNDSADIHRQAPAPGWNSGVATTAPRFTNASAAALAPVETPPGRLSTPRRTPTFEERIEPLLVRLRELGVMEYALERWGDSGTLYRFHCEMPLAASAVLTQQFEAVADDPQQSVALVVAQVSQWQTAQHRGGM
jgi:hypothetical protein